MGLMVVFVIGFFSSLVPSADEAWGRPTPEVAYDRVRLANRLRAQRNLLVGLILLILAVLGVVGPISLRAIRSILKSYSVLAAGVVLINVLLLAMGVTSLIVSVKLDRRRRELEQPGDPHGHDKSHWMSRFDGWKRLRNLKNLSWQRLVAAFAVLIAIWLVEFGPMRAHPLEVPKGTSPSAWQLVFSNSATLGFVRLALILLALFVIASIPALFVAGRWFKGFGAGGLTADDAVAADEQIEKHKQQSRQISRRLAETMDKLAQVKAERDRFANLANQAAAEATRFKQEIGKNPNKDC
jgi:small-conductance mechanosensitive channel